MDAAIETLTREGQGFFTRSQALSCGWLDRDLAAAVRAGAIRRLRHGAYSPAHTYDAADDVGRHILVARAALARQRGAVALTGVSAAAIRGYALHDQDLSTVHLVRLDGGSSRHEVGTRHHLMKPDISGDIEQVLGCPVVSAARTVWEVGTMSSVESALCTADSALHAQPDLLPELQALAPSYGHRPGSRRARVALALADGRAESPGESLSRVLFFRRGVPKPELQFSVRDADGTVVGVTDFYWPEYGHLGEFDGRVKYERLLRPGEAPGDVVFREKRREDRLRGLHYGMTRWTWSDLMPFGSDAFVRRLKEDLSRSQALRHRDAS